MYDGSINVENKKVLFQGYLNVSRKLKRLSTLIAIISSSLEALIASS